MACFRNRCARLAAAASDSALVALPAGYSGADPHPRLHDPADSVLTPLRPEVTRSELSETVPVCGLCGSDDAAFVRSGVRHSPDDKVFRCRSCGLVYLWPRPDEREAAAYYAEDYHPDYGEPPVEERYVPDLDEARVRVRRLLDVLGPDKALLEVGGGTGAFATSVAPYVGAVTVVEPENDARRFMHSMGVRAVAAIDELPQESFNLVVLFHVLEHVPSPTTFAASLRRLLRPNGRLVVEVPNVDDALVARYEVEDYIPFYYQRAHLYYFSAATLRFALEGAGLDVDIRGVQRYDLSNHLRWMLTGEPGGHGHYGELFTPGLLTAYADALVAAGHADTLWAVARVAAASG